MICVCFKPPRLWYVVLETIGNYNFSETTFTWMHVSASASKGTQTKMLSEDKGCSSQVIDCSPPPSWHMMHMIMYWDWVKTCKNVWDETEEIGLLLPFKFCQRWNSLGDFYLGITGTRVALLPKTVTELGRIYELTVSEHCTIRSTRLWFQRRRKLTGS